MESRASTTGVQQGSLNKKLLDIIVYCLTQVVNIPTSNDKTLHLLFTNFPSPVNIVKGMPPIGKADQDIVYLEYVYFSEDHSHISVNDMWVKFKTGFFEAVERFIPSKMTKTKWSVPWIDVTIEWLVKKRHKLYLHARKSKDPDVKIHYKRFRAHVQKVMRNAYWKYVGLSLR